MAIVRHTLEVGKKLTPEEHTAIAARLEEASKRPYVYDPDCPLMTEKQLSQFHPVNDISWEERDRLMKKAGITDPEGNLGSFEPRRNEPDISTLPKAKKPTHTLGAVANK
jgi:hypothetical protein